MIIEKDLQLLVKAASLADFKVDVKDFHLLSWKKGTQYHKPTKLPNGFFAVYIFKHNDKYLKVGKVSGEVNNDRYYQHHYIIKGANSTLAKSLVHDVKYSKLIGELKIRDWIISNIDRFNILIPKVHGSEFVNFAEAFFILKCKPLFEGKKKKHE